MHSRAAVCAIGAAMLFFRADAAFGQDKYPSKVIRFVTATPGSNHDWGARVTAQALTSRIGGRVIVENRGSIAVEHVAREAQPDGYTVLFYGAYCWLQPLLARVNWDPVADLAPITLAMTSPNVLVVHPSLPVKSVKELIALAKARPGDLNYSAGGGGSTPHVAGELFKYLAGVNIVRVRSPVADVLPGFSAEAAIGFFVPKRTAPAIVKFLHQEIVPALKGVDAKVLAAAGVEIVVNAPGEFAAFIKSDMARMSNMLKSANFSN